VEELLDHIARELAAEYVRLLKGEARKQQERGTKK
jgi:hypothetical protein